MFWDFPKTRNFWLDVQSWNHTDFAHSDNLTLTKEFIIFDSKINNFTDRIIDLFIHMAKHTDRILDLFIHMAKHHIFTAKI